MITKAITIIMFLALNIGGSTRADTVSETNESTARPYIAEGYPSHVQARREIQQEQLHNMARNSPSGLGLNLVLESANRWSTGGVITVAFNGGDRVLHQRIASIADTWARFANLTFDWGLNTSGDFRRWSETDSHYSADIRISFTRDSGYWSVVGTESINPSIARPNETSMMLAGFAYAWPHGGDTTVLHEFGHALGLHHEHQHPSQGCESEFRWYDDPGYLLTKGRYGDYVQDPNGRRPGLYTYLGGHSNNWPKSQVDSNLKQLTNSSAYSFGAFDSDSIMLYSFQPWMFVHSTTSYCYTPNNADLSDEDKRRIAEIYPSKVDTIRTVSGSQLEALDFMIDAAEGLQIKNFLSQRRSAILDSSK